MSEHACHYCGRTDGTRTRDHKVPRYYGGAGRGPENIAVCCMMCNMVKSAREYGMFVLLFGEFLEHYGEEYRAAHPDDREAIRSMQRRFDRWLRSLHSASTPTSPQ
jgi:5-methylcytosine-specific restriction endonuclease McrA